MAFQQEVQVAGDPQVYALSAELKRYTLRDLGFRETNAGGFLLERPLDASVPLARAIKLRMLVNKDLSGFKLSTVNPSGTGSVNIFTNANAAVLTEQYQFQINDLIERKVLRKVAADA